MLRHSVRSLLYAKGVQPIQTIDDDDMIDRMVWNGDQNQDHNFGSIELPHWALPVIGYIAGFVIMAVSRRLTCRECRRGLVTKSYVEDDIQMYRLINLKKRASIMADPLVVPRPWVVFLVRAVERCLRRFVNPHQLPGGMSRVILKVKQDMYDHGETIDRRNFTCQEHSLEVYNKLVNEAIRVRFHHIAKVQSDLLFNEHIRQQAVHSVIFAGQ